MKFVLNIKIARSLCAVFLVLGVLFFSFPTVFATSVDSNESTSVDTSDHTMYDPDSKQPYRYFIEIEFGAMQFYYDYGEWNPSTHRYEADTTSINPAADTDLGAPGWYGFDGTNNKITVTAKSGVNNTTLNVNVSFSTVDSATHTFPLEKDSVAMSFYFDAAFTQKIDTADNQYSLVFENGVINDAEGVDTNSKSFYVSFSGVPMAYNNTEDITDDKIFHSVGVAQGIGYLVFTVKNPETTTIENQNGDTSQ